MTYRAADGDPFEEQLPSETPVTDGERVYACFGNVGIWCFDLDGRELWTHPLEPRSPAFRPRRRWRT